MLARIPIVGRLFAEDSVNTIDDARRVVATFQAAIEQQDVEKSVLKAQLVEARQRRVSEILADLEALKSHKSSLEDSLNAVDGSISAKEAAMASILAADAVSEPKYADKITWEKLCRGDDSSTTAIIARLGADAEFDLKAREETEDLLARDAADDEKLAEGIALAVKHGVLEKDVQVEPVHKINVFGRCADEVADVIYSACVGAGDDGRVIVLQGLSGCGKGTTVSKLLKRFHPSVSWSNGNLFRCVTLLALEHCNRIGFEGSEDSAKLLKELSPENIREWLECLTFDHFDEGYDIAIDGEGVKKRVSHIANTLLKEKRIGKAIPTVASVSQGQVVTFADAALQRMKRDGLTVLVEGRAPTLAYVRSPLRFELTIDDPLLLGQRRVAQKLMAAAHAALQPGAGPPPHADGVEQALLKALRDI
ncbi:hypothetical protein M885DRAFT_583178 [Pelagophyceae sp. CCMP2097]|nr:hypothetical protein M885DRAFT_583178 [Pelagophyceae sp. CCMP2097]